MCSDTEVHFVFLNSLGQNLDPTFLSFSPPKVPPFIRFSGEFIMVDEEDRSIPLTNSSPIRIIEANWPVISHGHYEEVSWHDYEKKNFECCDMRVRSKNGRMLIYGRYETSTHQNHAVRRSGRIYGKSNQEELILAIRQVGRELDDEKAKETWRIIYAAVTECVAGLPSSN